MNDRSGMHRAPAGAPGMDLPASPDWPPAPAKPWQPASRSCLACGSRFASDHAGNRICAPCKGSDEWLAAAVLEPFFVRAEKRR